MLRSQGHVGQSSSGGQVVEHQRITARPRPTPAPRSEAEDREAGDRETEAHQLMTDRRGTGHELADRDATGQLLADRYAIGQLLADRYAIEGLLGRGGMADVFRGHDVLLQRPVAIKRMRAGSAANPVLRERFRREATWLAQLEHPSIVAVYDTGELIEPSDAAAVPYMIMELVDGQSLLTLLRQHRRVSPQRALSMTAAVADALACSHSAGIIHRDIKPGNILLTAAGEVKITDFGIARVLAADPAMGAPTATQTGTVLGTPHYMSPEQVRGEPVDARSDVYAVGCLLFQLLAGRPPFLGDSPLSIAYQHVAERPDPPSRYAPEVPAEIDAIVATALAKDPAQRHQTAADLRAELHAVLDGRAGASSPGAGSHIRPVAPTLARRSRRSVRSPGFTPLLLTIMVLGTLLAGAAGLLHGTDAPADEHRAALVSATRSDASSTATPPAAGPSAAADPTRSTAASPRPGPGVPATDRQRTTTRGSEVTRGGGPAGSRPKPANPTRPPGKAKAKDPHATHKAAQHQPERKGKPGKGKQ
ncbi:MAG TPA: protein kinase [Microlunatus sp.]|nr:protein kinase [Microlunatus sp.]